MKAIIKSQTEKFVLKLNHVENGILKSIYYLREDKAGNDPTSLSDFNMLSGDPNIISIEVVGKGISQVEREIEFETDEDLSILIDNFGNFYRRIKE